MSLRLFFTALADDALTSNVHAVKRVLFVPCEAIVNTTMSGAIAETNNTKTLVRIDGSGNSKDLLESFALIFVKLALNVVLAGPLSELGDAVDWVRSLTSTQVVCFTGAEEVLLDVRSHLHVDDD